MTYQVELRTQQDPDTVSKSWLSQMGLMYEHATSNCKPSFCSILPAVETTFLRAFCPKGSAVVCLKVLRIGATIDQRGIAVINNLETGKHEIYCV